MDRVGLRKSAIYERIARKQFPAPVVLGSTSRWVESEVGEWIQPLIDERDQAASRWCSFGVISLVSCPAIPFASRSLPLLSFCSSSTSLFTVVLFLLFFFLFFFFFLLFFF